MGYYNNRSKTSLERIRDAVENIDESVSKVVLFVTFTVTTESDTETWTADKTASEIIEAAEAGSLVVGVFSDEYGVRYMNLNTYSETDGEAIFQEWDVDVLSTLTLRQWIVDSGGVTKSEYVVAATANED